MMVSLFFYLPPFRWRPHLNTGKLVNTGAIIKKTFNIPEQNHITGFLFVCTG